LARGWSLREFSRRTPESTIGHASVSRMGKQSADREGGTGVARCLPGRKGVVHGVTTQKCVVARGARRRLQYGLSRGRQGCPPARLVTVIWTGLPADRGLRACACSPRIPRGECRSPPPRVSQGPMERQAACLVRGEAALLAWALWEELSPVSVVGSAELPWLPSFGHLLEVAANQKASSRFRRVAHPVTPAAS